MNLAEHKPLRIALLGYRSHPFGGGQGVYLHYLSKALVDAGHHVDVLSGQPYPVLDSRVNLIKIPGLDLYTHGLTSLRFKHLSSLTNIIEWLSKLTGGFAEAYCFGRRVTKYQAKHPKTYDIIHDNQSLSFGMLSLQARYPLVMTVHHPITSDRDIALKASTSWWERLLIHRWHAFLWMQQYVVKRLACIVTVSDNSKQDLVKQFQVKSSCVHRVYNGIDTNVFRPLPNVTRQSQRIMATASADQPLKGLKYLLLSYAQLLHQYPYLELLVVGKLNPNGETAALLQAHALTHRVRFVSNIATDELVALYAEATMVVVPSLYEGFGFPAGEAMACGVPVISTDGGALPEVVGDAGIIVPTHNSQAITEAVTFLLTNPDERARLALAGRTHIQASFCWQKVAEAMISLYRRAITDHANR